MAKVIYPGISNKQGGMSFSSLDSELRVLEKQGEDFLSQLSTLINTPNEDASVINELDANLSSRAEKIDDLYRAAHDPSAPSTAHAQAQRHREKLDEHRSSTQRLGNELRAVKDRHNLLSTVRADIETYRQQQAQDEDQYYYGEGGRIEQSHSLADRLLEQAQETRQDMLSQAATLRSVQRRIWQSASSVPGINTIISKINTRQKKNSLILATIVTLGVLFLVFV